jgi:hypothetical protein
MDNSFTRYLLAKQSVDDRALNRTVLDSLRSNLPNEPIRIIEVGAGIGTMLTRLLRWKLITKTDYTLVDQMKENIAKAQEWLPHWAVEAGLHVERIGSDQLRVFDSDSDIRIRFERADVLDFIQTSPAPADLLIAHAFLDLLPLPEVLPKLLSLTNNLAWLTINFDGLTSFEPIIDAEFDEQILRLYHATMDTRTTGGDSRTGRHLFSHLRKAGVNILSAGASDWVVHGMDGRYPEDEAYFLHFILHFFEESLSGHREVNPQEFANWLAKRHSQIERSELVYIAHQMDFLVSV